MANAFDAAVLAHSPLVYFDFDEESGNLSDATGNGNTGTVTNGTLVYGESPLAASGSSVDFSTGDVVSITESSTFSIDDFTVVMLADWAGAADRIVAGRAAQADMFTPNFGWAVRTDTPADQIRLSVGYGSNVLHGDYKNVTPDQTFLFVATVSSSGSNIIIGSSIDGGARTFRSVSSQNIDWSGIDTFQIGRSSSGFAGHFDGFAVIPSLLTNTQIAALWDAVTASGMHERIIGGGVYGA